VKNLERYDPLMLRVLSETDRRHPAATELAVDGVRRSQQLPDAPNRQSQARTPRSKAVGRAGLFKLRRPEWGVKDERPLREARPNAFPAGAVG
jgi:hypothetical protein